MLKHVNDMKVEAVTAYIIIHAISCQNSLALFEIHLSPHISLILNLYQIV